MWCRNAPRSNLQCQDAPYHSESGMKNNSNPLNPTVILLQQCLLDVTMIDTMHFDLLSAITFTHQNEVFSLLLASFSVVRLCHYNAFLSMSLSYSRTEVTLDECLTLNSTDISE